MVKEHMVKEHMNEGSLFFNLSVLVEVTKPLLLGVYKTFCQSSHKNWCDTIPGNWKNSAPRVSGLLYNCNIL